MALEKAGLLCFAHGRYYTLGRDLGAFGFSVDKSKENKTKPRKSKFLEILKIEKQIKDGVSKIKDKKLKNILNSHKNISPKGEAKNKPDTNKHTLKNNKGQKASYRSQFGKKSSKK